MNEFPALPGWTGSTRSDGVQVRVCDDGLWIVIPPPGDDRPVLRACPCCDKTMPTQRVAKLVANATYPMLDG